MTESDTLPPAMVRYLDDLAIVDGPELVSAYDELSLWSAPFGNLPLEHVPLRRGMRVLDVGCGTGFPLLELAERLGGSSLVVGVDLWKTALSRAMEKGRQGRIGNAPAVVGDAARLPLKDGSIDLVVSNLGLNNFDAPEAVFAECARVAKPGATLALTTNLVGHWRELYEEFASALSASGLERVMPALRKHVEHRATVSSVRSLVERGGFVVTKVVEDRFTMRFADGEAFLRHHFVRLAFLPDWVEVLRGEEAEAVIAGLARALDERADLLGELELTVPMAYVEAERR